MIYVEWLRARRVLIGMGITLAAFVVIGLGLRIWTLQYSTPEKFVQAIQMDPGATRREMTLPDGTHRTIVDDPAKRTRVVIDDRGYAGKHVVITEPRGAHPSDFSHVNIGSVSVDTTDNGTMERIVVDSDHGATFAPYLGIGWFLAMIVATFLGAPFARENDGHLEYAFTKPVSRTKLALAIVGVDAAAIIATIVATVAVLMGLQLLFEPVRISGWLAFEYWGTSILVPLGWYALLNAATASLRRAYGVMLGLSWPVLFGINGFAAIPWNDSTLGRVLWAVSHAIVFLNPISYFMPGDGGIRISDRTDIIGISHQAGVLVALILFLVYTALAVVQWRRVEA